MTTPDPVALKEALDNPDYLVHTDYDGSWELSEDGQVVFATARWALDRIEGGKEVWYCEVDQETKHSEYDCDYVAGLLDGGFGFGDYDRLLHLHTKCGKRLLVAL